MTAKWTDFVSGAVLTAAQLNDVLDNFQDIAVFNETQSIGTESGTFTSGAWTKRVLNTTVVNNITGCSIASSVVTLTAGTYYIKGECLAFGVNSHKLVLQNTTASTQAIIGMNGYCVQSGGNGLANDRALVEGVITITGSTNFELQHRCTTTKTGNGLGAAGNITSEVYSILSIRRIA